MLMFASLRHRVPGLLIEVDRLTDQLRVVEEREATVAAEAAASSVTASITYGYGHYQIW